MGTSVKIFYAKGCSITTNEGDSPMQAWLNVNRQEFPTAAQDEADIAQAVKVASQADVIVLVLGENELICREAWSDEHFGDRASLDLFGRQNELAAAIFKLGKPVVVYLMNGRPLAIPQIVEKADAVLEGWYAGQETGHAAADILFGRVNPSANLSQPELAVKTGFTERKIKTWEHDLIIPTEGEWLVLVKVLDMETAMRPIG